MDDAQKGEGRDQKPQHRVSVAWCGRNVRYGMPCAVTCRKTSLLGAVPDAIQVVCEMSGDAASLGGQQTPCIRAVGKAKIVTDGRERLQAQCALRDDMRRSKQASQQDRQTKPAEQRKTKTRTVTSLSHFVAAAATKATVKGKLQAGMRRVESTSPCQRKPGARLAERRGQGTKPIAGRGSRGAGANVHCVMACAVT
eukprot:2974639-Pleurochrysis_carterae.AAC.1